MPNLNIQKNSSLQSLNTLSVPAMAERFVEVTSVDELVQALKLANQNRWTVLVLGEGSNLVLPDHIDGLVVKNSIKGIALDSETEDEVCLTAGAGENWHQLVCYCLNAGYWGLENLSLIPGTVGAAPIQNIGAYGVELKSVFKQLTAINRATGEQRIFSAEECEFGYRDSVFKNRLRNQMVISSVTLCLSKKPSINISYPALLNALSAFPEAELTPLKISEAVCQIRRSKLPDPAVIPNAGSFFKNPIVSELQFQQLQTTHPGIVAYTVKNESSMKLAAGWLLDAAGWKGKQENGVGMHKDQALVLTNSGYQSAAEILTFAAMIQTDIKARYGVELEIEPSCY